MRPLYAAKTFETKTELKFARFKRVMWLIEVQIHKNCINGRGGSPSKRKRKVERSSSCGGMNQHALLSSLDAKVCVETTSS